MRITCKHIMLLFVSFMMTVFSFSQEPAHREFDAQKIEEYRKQSDYQYAEKVRFSIWDWITSILKKLEEWGSYENDTPVNINPSYNGPSPGDILVGIIALLAVAAVLYIIFKGNWAWLFNKGKKIDQKDDGYMVYDEDIHNINFTDEIELAVQEKNYRKATRLFYLKSLKLLSDNNYIIWKINKTNTDYRREIKDKTIRDEFDHLSFTFDYVWYGELELTDKIFQENFEKFRQFNKRFNNTAA